MEDDGLSVGLSVGDALGEREAEVLLLSEPLGLPLLQWLPVTDTVALPLLVVDKLLLGQAVKVGEPLGLLLKLGEGLGDIVELLQNVELLVPQADWEGV